MTEIKPNSMLIINTPQVDYILNDKSGVWVNGALQAERNILDQIFVMGYMNAMQFVGITVDFFSSMAKLFKENGGTDPVHCLSFSEGAGIEDNLLKILSFSLKCPIKKLPKNDEKSNEKSVFQNEDSGKFILQTLDPNNKEISVSDIYICGISYDGSILATLNDLLQILQPGNIHIFKDCIACSSQIETNEIMSLCSSKQIEII